MTKLINSLINEINEKTELAKESMELRMGELQSQLNHQREQATTFVTKEDLKEIMRPGTKRTDDLWDFKTRQGAVASQRTVSWAFFFSMSAILLSVAGFIVILIKAFA